MQVLSCVRPRLMASDASTIGAVVGMGMQHYLDLVPLLNELLQPTGDVLFVRHLSAENHTHIPL